MDDAIRGLYGAAAGATRRCRIRWSLAVALAAGPLAAQEDAGDLMDLDLESLFAVKVTLVSRKAEDPMDAPAAVFVLSNEDIRRSGATNLPDALRLVPGMHVGRIDANQWAVSARGFNLRFANKLLVLIDGRSAYTPAFSGVYWEAQDVDLGDVERIEVVRGPGATLWGVNAVNGIVNIVTRPAAETGGWRFEGTAGTEDRGILVGRYGGRLGPGADYRVYGKYFRRDSSALAGGGDGGDPWDKVQVGFRVDGKAFLGGDWTVQGDAYDGRVEHWIQIAVQDSPIVQRFIDEVGVGGFNLLGRWRRQIDEDEDIEVQLYVDRARRDEVFVDERRTTFDMDMQHRFGRGRHDIVWGVGARASHDSIASSFAVDVKPASRRLDQFSGFVQDDIELAPERLRLIAGTKVSHDEFDGLTLQPSLRLVWRPSPRQSLWGGVSRALRSPSRGENDTRLMLPNDSFDVGQGALPLVPELDGGGTLGSERLVAWEAGYRWRPTTRLGVELAAYHNRYTGLVTSGDIGTGVILEEPAPHLRLPVPLENLGRIELWGLEVSGDWQVLEAWRLSAHYSYLKKSAGSDFSSIQSGDPSHQGLLRWHGTPGRRWELDGVLRYVGDLSNETVDAYAELDLRLGYEVADGLQLAVVGQNLLSRRHREFVNDLFNGAVNDIERGVYASLNWTRE